MSRGRPLGRVYPSSPYWSLANDTNVEGRPRIVPELEPIRVVPISFRCCHCRNAIAVFVGVGEESPEFYCGALRGFWHTDENSLIPNLYREEQGECDRFDDVGDGAEMLRIRLTTSPSPPLKETEVPLRPRRLEK